MHIVLRSSCNRLSSMPAGASNKRRGDRFCEAQAVCNVIEVAFQLYALRLLNTRGSEALGLLMAFTTQAFTFWKTCLVSELRIPAEPAMSHSAIRVC